MTRIETNGALTGAGLMIAAGAAFAAVNVGVQGATMTYGLASTTVVFWQYAIALLVCLPVLNISRALRAGDWRWHLVRVILAAIGVQFWVAGLAYVPIWQAIALILLSPFFVTLGAAVLLNEKVTPARWGAVVIGIVGGCIVLAPWSDAFTASALYPIAAAVFWAASSLLTKRLALQEDASVLTVWLLVLLLPINFGLTLGNGFAIGWGWPLALVFLAGVFTALAQYALARAYRSADAAYLQPFDHLKLPMNLLFGFLAFGFAPEGWIWLGVVLILAAGLWLFWQEKDESPMPA